MNRRKLVLTDILWAIVLILMVFVTDVFRRQILLMILLVLFVFAGYILRHMNYYRLTKKIY